MELAVTIDGDACMGHARCVTAAPGVFDIGDDGRAVTRAPVVAGAAASLARDAAQACPERAIHLQEVLR